MCILFLSVQHSDGDRVGCRVDREEGNLFQMIINVAIRLNFLITLISG